MNVDVYVVYARLVGRLSQTGREDKCVRKGGFLRIVRRIGKKGETKREQVYWFHLFSLQVGKFYSFCFIIFMVTNLFIIPFCLIYLLLNNV